MVAANRGPAPKKGPAGAEAPKADAPTALPHAKGGVTKPRKEAAPSVAALAGKPLLGVSVTTAAGASPPEVSIEGARARFASMVVKLKADIGGQQKATERQSADLREEIASKGESHYQEARVLMENAQKVIATATEHHDAAKERLRQVSSAAVAKAERSYAAQQDAIAAFKRSLEAGIAELRGKAVKA